MSDLSLFDIERALHELLDAWQEAATPEALAAAEQAIAVYAQVEVRKADGIAAYLRGCDVMAGAARDEAIRQTKRQQTWLARKDCLKAFVYDTMNSFGVRKIEGKTATLSIRGNGGVQPLTVYDASLVPDELCDVTVTMSAFEWSVACRELFRGSAHGERIFRESKTVRTPSNERIRAALAKRCQFCVRPGWYSDHEEFGPGGRRCDGCGGTGHELVPGARLEERGESVVVK